MPATYTFNIKIGEEDVTQKTCEFIEEAIPCEVDRGYIDDVTGTQAFCSGLFLRPSRNGRNRWQRLQVIIWCTSLKKQPRGKDNEENLTRLQAIHRNPAFS